MLCQPHNETLFKKHKKHAVRTRTTRILAYPGRVAIFVHSYAIQIQGPFTVAAGMRVLGVLYRICPPTTLTQLPYDSQVGFMLQAKGSGGLSEWPLDFLHLRL